eukprot:XP_766416.1 hypothetical protein [Theileria parva strain Muguga]
MMQPIRTYNLPPFSELRIITNESFSSIPLKPSITLINKNENESAEIFGKELVPGVEVPLNEGERIAIYTWSGCTLQIKGSTLQILVTGSPSSGKSSFCTILCNYALRFSWKPLFIDADPRSSCDKSSIKLYPGTVGCVLYDNMDTAANPLLYYYGYSYYQDNEFLYLHLMKLLNVNVELMLYNNDNVIKSSGIVINAPYECNKDMIVKLCKIYKVSVIVVIDSPSIHQELIKHYKNERNNIDINIANLAYNNIIINNENDGKPDKAQEAGKLSDTNENAKNSDDEMLILSSSKLEGVISVDYNRLKYINNMNWNKYFEINNLGRNHVIKVNSDTINFIYIDIIEPLTKDALPTNEDYVMKHKEMYCNVYNDDLLLLNNLIVAVPATDDIKLIPYTNILSFFHISSIESNATEDNTFTISFCCQTNYSPSSLPKYLLLPRDFKTLKYNP